MSNSNIKLLKAGATYFKSTFVAEVLPMGGGANNFIYPQSISFYVIEQQKVLMLPELKDWTLEGLDAIRLNGMVVWTAAGNIKDCDG